MLDSEESSCSDNNFDNYEDSSDDEADDFVSFQISDAEKDKFFTPRERTHYNVEGMNQMLDLTQEQFTRDAEDFMKAIGEDNIFMSGLNWLQN